MCTHVYGRLCLSIMQRRGTCVLNVYFFIFFIYTGINLYFNLLYLIALDLYIIYIFKGIPSWKEPQVRAHTHTSHIYTLVALPLFHSSPLSECNLGNVSTLLFLKEAEPPCDAPAVLA